LSGLTGQSNSGREKHLDPPIKSGDDKKTPTHRGMSLSGLTGQSNSGREKHLDPPIKSGDDKETPDLPASRATLYCILT
jgi:hypothetical protein